MNLGLQLVLGGLRKRPFVPGVDGEGTVSAMSDGFQGHKYLDVTGLVADEIYTYETNDTAPKVLICDARNVRFSGSRLLTNNPVNAWEDFYYRWTITYEDGSPVEYWERENVTDELGNAVNIFTETKDPILKVPLRENRTYKRRLDVYASTNGQVRHNFIEDTIVVTENTLTVACVNSVGGNDADDGLDMWGGVTLTNATYTEADGYLTEVGAWTAYDHTFATAGPVTRWCNFKNLDGIGRVYIAEKISNDTVRLEDASKLGADQTGITSTSGPKQTYTSASDRKLLLYPGSYVLNNDVAVVGVLNKHVACVGGGEAVFTSASGLRMLYTGSGSSAPVSSNGFSYFEGIKFDAEDVENRTPIGGTVTSTNAGKITLFLNDVSGINCYSAKAVDINTGFGTSVTMHILHQGGELNALDNVTVEPAVTPNDGGVYNVKKKHEAYAITNVTIKCIGHSSLLHHFIYTNGDPTGYSAGWVHFADGNADGLGYCLNINNATPDEAKSDYVSVHNCLADGNSQFYVDLGLTGSGGNLEYNTIHDCRVKTANTFALYDAALSATFARITWWHSGANGFRLVHLNTSAPSDDLSKYKMTLRDNFVAGNLIRRIDDHGGVEAFDNEVYQSSEGTDPYTLWVSDTLVEGGVYYGRNSLYDVNKTNSVRYGATQITVDAFNTALEYTGDDVNAAIDKGYADPNNGDWSLTPTSFELNFNRANSAYASFTEINLTAGEKFRISFKASPSAVRRLLVDRLVGAGSAGNRCPIEFDATNRLVFLSAKISSLTIDGDVIIVNESITPYLDNLPHTIEMTIASGQTATFGVIGSTYLNSLHFDGVLFDVEFDKFVEGVLTTVLKWNVDSGSITTEASTIGSANMTFVNVVEADWSPTA